MVIKYFVLVARGLALGGIGDCCLCALSSCCLVFVLLVFILISR